MALIMMAMMIMIMTMIMMAMMIMIITMIMMTMMIIMTKDNYDKDYNYNNNCCRNSTQKEEVCKSLVFRSTRAGESTEI
jgi:predicted lipid-binding transport protein (Tim44 family)